MTDLSGTLTLVTGASSGIGASIAAQIAISGGDVVLCGRSAERLGVVASSISADRIKGRLLADFRDSTECEAIVERAVSECGRPLSGIVHSAGLYQITPLRMIDADEVDDLWRINVRAPIMLSRAFRRQSPRCEDSRIIFISSVAGLRGQSGLCAYSATKGALIAMARSMAVELAPDGIRVNVIAPGMVASPLQERIFEGLPQSRRDSVIRAHPLGLGDALSVAQAAAFLLSAESRWMTGTTLTVDGGFSAG